MFIENLITNQIFSKTKNIILPITLNKKKFYHSVKNSLEIQKMTKIVTLFKT